MTPKLTAEQCEALDRADGPVPVEDDRTHRLYFLVDAETLRSIERQHDIAAIRSGIADMEAGRVLSLDELDARIRPRFGWPTQGMSYAVVVTEQAANEIEDAAAWWANERSSEQAQKWYIGIREAIAGLAMHPERCPVSSERAEFPYEIRDLYYGLRSKPTHRVVFTILSNTVLVLSVRHVSRGQLRPDELH